MTLIEKYGPKAWDLSQEEPNGPGALMYARQAAKAWLKDYENQWLRRHNVDYHGGLEKEGVLHAWRAGSLMPWPGSVGLKAQCSSCVQSASARSS